MIGIKDKFVNILELKNNKLDYFVFLVKNLLVLFFWRRPILLLILFMCLTSYLSIFNSCHSIFNFTNGIWQLNTTYISKNVLDYYFVFKFVVVLLISILFLVFFCLGYNDYRMQKYYKNMVISSIAKMKATTSEDKLIGAQEIENWMKKDYLYDEILIYYLKK